MAKIDNNEEVPQNLEELAKPEPENTQDEPVMLGSAQAADTPPKGDDFFQRLRETFTNAKKAISEFIQKEKDSISKKQEQIKALEAEIEDHNTNIKQANEHLGG